MPRLRLFLSRFVLSLWLLLFSAFVCLLLFESRGGGVTVPMGEVSIFDSAGATVLPNRIFTCTETEQQARCQATVQDRSLVFTLTPKKSSNAEFSLRDCQATYDGQAVRCRSVGFDYAPALAESIEIEDLSLSLQQQQALRKKYWGVRTLQALSETRLLQISSGLSIASGAIAAYFAWFYSSRLTKGLASIACGFLTYYFVWRWLGSVPFDAVIPYRFTVDTWTWTVEAGAAALGVMAAVAVALLLRRRAGGATKTIVTLSSGIGTVLMSGYFLLLMLLGSGFVD